MNINTEFIKQLMQGTGLGENMFYTGLGTTPGSGYFPLPQETPGMPGGPQVVPTAGQQSARVGAPGQTPGQTPPPSSAPPPTTGPTALPQSGPGTGNTTTSTGTGTGDQTLGYTSFTDGIDAGDIMNALLGFYGLRQQQKQFDKANRPTTPELWYPPGGLTQEEFGNVKNAVMNILQSGQAPNTSNEVVELIRGLLGGRGDTFNRPNVPGYIDATNPITGENQVQAGPMFPKSQGGQVNWGDLFSKIFANAPQGTGGEVPEPPPARRGGGGGGRAGGRRMNRDMDSVGGGRDPFGGGGGGGWSDDYYNNPFNFGASRPGSGGGPLDASGNPMFGPPSSGLGFGPTQFGEDGKPIPGAYPGIYNYNTGKWAEGYEPKLPVNEQEKRNNAFLNNQRQTGALPVFTTGTNSLLPDNTVQWNLRNTSDSKQLAPDQPGPSASDEYGRTIFGGVDLTPSWDNEFKSIMDFAERPLNELAGGRDLSQHPAFVSNKGSLAETVEERKNAPSSDFDSRFGQFGERPEVSLEGLGFNLESISSRLARGDREELVAAVKNNELEQEEQNAVISAGKKVWEEIKSFFKENPGKAVGIMSSALAYFGVSVNPFLALGIMFITNIVAKRRKGKNKKGNE